MSTDIPTPPAAARDCTEGHAWTTYLRGGEPIEVRICVVCRVIHWDDLRAQVDAIRAEATVGYEHYSTALAEERDGLRTELELLRAGLPARDARIAADAEERGWHRGFDHARRYPDAARDARIRAETIEDVAGMLDAFAAARTARAAEHPPETRLAHHSNANVLGAYRNVARVVREYGRIRCTWSAISTAVAVPAEGSEHPQPVRHGSDGPEGYMSIRCAEDRPGCVGRGCICRCHEGESHV